MSFDQLTTAEKVAAAYKPALAYIERHEGDFWGTYDVSALVVIILGAFEELDDTLSEDFDQFRPSKWGIRFANGDMLENKVFRTKNEANFFARIEEDRLVTAIANLQARKILVPLEVVKI